MSQWRKSGSAVMQIQWFQCQLVSANVSATALLPFQFANIKYLILTTVVDNSCSAYASHFATSLQILFSSAYAHAKVERWVFRTDLCNHIRIYCSFIDHTNHQLSWNVLIICRILISLNRNGKFQFDFSWIGKLMVCSSDLNLLPSCYNSHLFPHVLAFPPNFSFLNRSHLLFWFHLHLFILPCTFARSYTSSWCFSLFSMQIHTVSFAYVPKMNGCLSNTLGKIGN